MAGSQDVNKLLLLRGVGTALLFPAKIKRGVWLSLTLFFISEWSVNIYQ